MNVLSDHGLIILVLFLNQGLGKEFHDFFNFETPAPNMVQDCSILQESEIAIVVNDMDWGNRIFLVFLSDPHVLLPAVVIAVKVHSWAMLE